MGTGRWRADRLQPVLLEPLFPDTHRPAARFHHLQRNTTEDINTVSQREETEVMEPETGEYCVNTESRSSLCCENFILYNCLICSTVRILDESSVIQLEKTHKCGWNTITKGPRLVNRLTGVLLWPETEFEGVQPWQLGLLGPTETWTGLHAWRGKDEVIHYSSEGLSSHDATLALISGFFPAEHFVIIYPSVYFIYV